MNPVTSAELSAGLSAVLRPLPSPLRDLSRGPVEGMNGRCPQCHYHQTERIMVVVVRTSCPNCHYIEQGRRSPIFADLTELIAWLSEAEELRGRGAEEQKRGERFTSAPLHLCPSAQNEEVPCAHQIRNPKSEILTPVGFRGLSGWCTGWAGDEQGTVYASFIGRVTALTGIWAAFQDNEVLKLLDRPDLFKRPKIDDAKYHTLRARLPETGWQHLVLLHTQATVDNLPDLDFYVLSESPDPPLGRFWAQWNNALPLPALPEWVNTLWHEGVATGLITPCPAEAITCWRVRVDPNAWRSILQQIVTRGEVCHEP